VGLQTGLTGLVVIGALALLMASAASPDVVLLGAVVILALAGVLTPTEALSGFANTGMLTVAALFVVAAGLRETGAVSAFTSRLLGRPRTPRGALLRLVPPVVVASAFLNNTTVVASLLPGVHEWARRIDIAPSRVLLPLSYATILGGVCTLVGTSTNLVVAGLVDERLATTQGLRPLGMFELSWVGVPVAVVGSIALIALAPLLLPDRRPPLGSGQEALRFTIELLVPPDSSARGKTIEEAGLYSVRGARLVEVRREGTVIPATDAFRRLEAGDRVLADGDLDAMVEIQRLPGFVAATAMGDGRPRTLLDRSVVQAVISHRNPLIGLTIREGQFRNRYQAVVLAVAHAGDRVHGPIGEVVLHAGDVLLLETHPDFAAKQRFRTDFTLVGAVEGARAPRTERAGTAILVLAAMVVVAGTGVLPTVTAAFLAAGAMVGLGCCTLHEARRSLDLQVLVAIAAAFGLGTALERSGLAAEVATGAVSLGAASPVAALVATYLVTAALTEVITNNAAAVLALPLALSLAEKLDASPMPFVFAICVAASASFLTPIGYQTNLMVMGPGGYRASDYPRAGLPLAVAVAATTLFLVPRLWPL
jgi:di/tricarboxylate transporter